MLSKLLTYIAQLPVIVRLVEWSKRIILPGFDRIPLYDVVRFFGQAIAKGMLATRASAVAFSFFLALFPGVLFLFALIPYVPIDNFQEQLLGQLQLLLPQDAYESSRGTIEDLVLRQHGGVLSFGFIGALYFASNGIARMMGAFNQSILVEEKRSFVVQRLVAIALLLILALLTVAAIALIVFKSVIETWLINEGYIENQTLIYAIRTANWLVIVALFYFSISFIYWLGPAGLRTWKFFSAGSTLATILLILVSLAFAWFVNNFGRFNTLYGSIGSLIVVMLWMNWVALILLTGFELNASIKSAPGKLTNTLSEPS